MSMCTWFKKIFGHKGGSSNSEGPPKIACPHTWKDFPWYTHSIYNAYTSNLEVQIYEPYVCIHCKERKDIRLDTYIRTNIPSLEKAHEEVSRIEKDLEGHAKPRVLVEDMINDYIYVDREKLGIIEKIRDLKAAPKMEEVHDGE